MLHSLFGFSSSYFLSKYLGIGLFLPLKYSPSSAYNWTLIRDSYGLGDLIKAKGIKLPKNIEDALKGESTTSAPKGSERKGAKNESNKIKASQSTLDMLK